MLRIGLRVLGATLLATMASAAIAGTYSTNNPTIAPGANGTVTVSFAGDGTTQDSQWDFTYNTAVLTPSAPMILVPGSVCSIFPAAGMVPAFVRVSPPSGAGNPVTSTNTAYCSFTFAVAAGAATGQSAFTTRFIECEGAAGPVAPCTGSGFVNVAAGPADVSPNLTYNPPSGGAITLTAAGANATGVIAITPAGGTGVATTTVGSCTFAANTASLASSPATLTFTGPTTTAQNLNLTCVRQAAAVTALLTCSETQSDGTPAGAQARTFNVTCPAAVAADVSPNVAFTPSPLTLTGTGAATGTLTGTPSGGTGAATTVATCADDAGGPTFTVAPASRTFTGSATTTQTYAIGCTTAAAAASGTITCSQVQSDGTNPAPVQVTVNCPATAAGPGPEFNSTPPAGSTISLNGTVGGTNPTSLVTVSNSEAATTLIVTAAITGAGLSVSPAGPLSIVPGTPQSFTVSCSAATAGTFTGTLTLTTNDPDDAETTVTYPVTCTIIAGGGGTQATAVPTLSPAGKLIAIFSMLGLGLLGFAVTRRA